MLGSSMSTSKEVFFWGAIDRAFICRRPSTVQWRRLSSAAHCRAAFQGIWFSLIGAVIYWSEALSNYTRH